jgi:hypothetical protein
MSIAGRLAFDQAKPGKSDALCVNSYKSRGTFRRIHFDVFGISPVLNIRRL